MSLKLTTAAAIAVLAAAALIASSVDAQTYSGGRQGTHGGGRGYSWTASRSGSTVTGGVQTNRGYGGSATHTGGYNAYGGYAGTSHVSTNNGSTLSTRGGYYNGYAAGSATATGPAGQSVSGVGAVYVPR